MHNCKTYSSTGYAQIIHKMLAEKSKHEGTWLRWPHEFTYGKEYKQEIGVI